MLSPDGKYLWTGSEWIPAPPTNSQSEDTDSILSIDLKDSVIAGDITINKSFDTDLVIEKMKRELSDIDSIKSGFHIPEGGFSGPILAQGIETIKQNKMLLNTFSIEQLLDFVSALEPIGYPELVSYSCTLIIANSKSKNDHKSLALGYLFEAKTKGSLGLLYDAIKFSDESARLALEFGFLEIEAEAIWISLDNRQLVNDDISYYDHRLDHLLANSESLDMYSYCYTLAAKAISLRYTDSIVSEEFELSAYKNSIQIEDIRLQVFTATELIGNKVHKIEKHELIAVKEKCLLNSLNYYAGLIDFCLNTEFDENVSSSILSVGEKYEIPILKIFAKILSYANNISESLAESEDFASYASNQALNDLFEILIATRYSEPIFYSQFLCLKLIDNQNRSIDKLLSINPIKQDPSIKLISEVNYLINSSAPLEQLIHYCVPLDRDNDQVLTIKFIILTFLFKFSLLTSNEYLQLPNLDPSHKLKQSDKENYLTLKSLHSSYLLTFEKWNECIELNSEILNEENFLKENSDLNYILTSSLSAIGICHLQLKEYDKSLSFLDKSIFWSKKFGEDYTDVDNIFKQVIALKNVKKSKFSLPSMSTNQNIIDPSKDFEHKKGLSKTEKIVIVIAEILLGIALTEEITSTTSECKEVTRGNFDTGWGTVPIKDTVCSSVPDADGGVIAFIIILMITLWIYKKFREKN